MKNFNLALFLGCIAVSAGIIIAGALVSARLADIATKTPVDFPSYLNVTTLDGTPIYREYMSEYEASAFLMMATDDFIAFINSGELDGTYTIVQENYVFSKEKLTQWIDDRIDNQ